MPARTTRDLTVLVADDDAMARSWLRLSLRNSEFQVVAEAATAGEALALASVIRPDLVLVDDRLPDSPGVDLVRELRRRGFAAPVVLTATMAEPGLNESALSAGAQGTLLKTGSPTELLDALRSVEGGSNAFDFRHPRRPPAPR